MAVAQLVIFAGQSQCNSNGNTNAQTVPTAISGPMADVYIWDPFGKAWLTYQAQVTSAAHLKGGKYPDTSQNYFGAEAEYARRWKIDNPGVPLYIVKKGHSTTSLSQSARTANRGCWDPNLRDDLFDEFVSQTADAKANLTAAGNTVNIRGMNWTQGENDAGSTADVASAYATNLSAFVDAVRNAGIIAATTPFVISRIQTANWANPAAVRAAQQSVGETKPYCRWFNADTVAIDGADTVHYGPNGVVTHGALMYAAAISTTAFPQYPAITMTPSQLTIVSGTPTQGTDFDGAPVLQLPNGSSEFAVIPDLPLGIKHDVYINWTVSAVPANLSPVGRVTFVGELTPWTVGGSTPAGTSRWSGIVPPQAPGVVERSQLPWSVTRATANDLMRIRLGRRADNLGTGNLVQIRSVEFVPTPAAVEATITQSGSVTPTVTKTSFDGSAVLHGLAIYTPIRSSQTALYVVEPVTIGGVQQSRLAKLNKSTYATLQDVQLTSVGTHDTVVGHRDGSVIVTDSGKLICYGEGHHSPWSGKIALTEDLATLSAMAVPTGLDKHCSYRRFYRNPFDGSTWMAARGNDYNAAVWKFNDATNTFERKPSASFLAADPGTFLGSYGMELAFGSAEVIYATTEFYQGNSTSTLSGYPRQNLSVVKSVDGGATWQTMRGKAVGTPMVQMSVDDDIAFPANNGLHNAACGRLAVGADGQPVMVATWTHPSDSTRALWVAKWDNSAKKWIRRRLFRATTAFDVGNPHLAYHDGKIVVSISTTDDHTPGPSSSGGGGERVPADNKILLFVTTNSAATWRRYDVNHAAGGYGGAYIDAEALRLDNKLRMRPVNSSAPTTSVIWEMPVPDAADTTAPVMTGEITVSAITTSGATLSCPTATDAVGVAGYEYSIDGSENYIVIPNAARSVVVSGLPAGMLHEAYMRAFDAAGNRSQQPLVKSFTTLSAQPPAQDAVVAATVAESRRVAFPGGTRVVAFGTVPSAAVPNAPYLEAGRWWSEKHPLDERYWVADITIDLDERATTAKSVERIVAGVTVLEEPVIQGKLIPVKLGGFNAATGAINYCTFRVTCANGERFDRTIWFKQTVGAWWINKDADDQSYYVADIGNDLIDSGTTATAVKAFPVGVVELVPAVIQGPLILVKLGGMDTLPAGVNYCDFRIDCANGERFYRSMQFNRVDN